MPKLITQNQSYECMRSPNQVIWPQGLLAGLGKIVSIAEPNNDKLCCNMVLTSTMAVFSESALTELWQM
ncbi:MULTISPECIES: hypothetical protein [unclassified Tolypothrix]|uniref:hypothetical protein n=1 Tax=unclassified Tolypothrix TaxID=2649714 RepID=UPI0005EAC176|nr:MULTISPECIES: hypothetical protein [unclassified Tolypothrix]BAY88866.1 hypothetical protein NIES3275_08660 [Microchaete diplosiphon NIES-3275]EKF02720.1 hypothetical protein FDUTEX481_05518 [Tolypothrix sp. PCC 7601]MBE9087594.1 hypothetical protein [Tolypothrix sp. LEGE 11397]UYD29509.1 hypothetical protein HGR01_16695 [Tolypothrix sp. PCC 7712]UYD34578.1 hypothetical protein HG267_01610 [Tolypothrix sp. PCC 7601]